MTQSESPDFELDPSSLDIESDGATAAQRSEDASERKAAAESRLPAGATRAEDLSGDFDVETTSAELEELAGFDVGALPDPFSDPAVARPYSTKQELQSEAGSATDESGAAEAPVLRQHRGADSLRRREMGEDDVGADVFAEIDEDELAPSFDSALEDLLSDVDRFEIGELFDKALEEEAMESAAPEGVSSLFSLDDPDDSIGSRQPLDPTALAKELVSELDLEPLSSGVDEVLDADFVEENDDEQLADSLPIKPVTVAEDDFVIPSDEGLIAETAFDEELPVGDEVASDKVAQNTDLEFPENEAAILEDEPVLESEAADTVDSTNDATPVSPNVVDEVGDGGSKVDDVEAIDADARSEAEIANPRASDQTLVGGLTEVEDEEEGENSLLSEEPEAIGNDAKEVQSSISPTSSEDLLRMAGSLFNKAEPSGEQLDDDEEPVEAMPSPQDLMQAAASSSGTQTPDPEVDIEAEGVSDSPAADDDGDVFQSLPDPLSLLEEASEMALPKTGGSGNVADRGGDLPPPPPAPVEIFDEDPLDEDPQLREPLPTPFAEPALMVASEDFALSDPFAATNALDGFNEGVAEDDAFEDALLGDLVGLSVEAPAEGLDGTAGDRQAAGMMIRPPRWKRVLQSFGLAAGLTLLGAGWFFQVWKQEIMEYVEGRDIDGSALVAQIRAIGNHAIDGFDEVGRYHMQWVDSELRRVAENEIRLHANLSARLKDALFEEVSESELEEELRIDEADLNKALHVAQEQYPQQMKHFPIKPWEKLYRQAHASGESLALRVLYRLTREDSESEWELASVRVRGADGDLEWPKGISRSQFGAKDYDIDSSDFVNAVTAYRESSRDFVVNIDALQNSSHAALAAMAVENAKRREQVVESLAAGVHFSGVAIIGEEGQESRSVTMVITDVRESGALVRGVFKVDDSATPTKHFIGNVAFASSSKGVEQGILNVTTIAFEEVGRGSGSLSFFDADSVSRLRLKTDGLSMEGDSRDFSLRLNRSM